MAASTSRRRMRPCGPLPVRAARSTPPSPAMRRASGLAKIREPPMFGVAVAGVMVAKVVVVGTIAAGAATGAGSAGAGSAGTGSGATTGAAATSAALSPSSARRAIAVPTATPSAPLSTRMAARTPSSTASTSIVALSVSISAMTSPLLTVSPTATFHFARVPVSMVGDSAGIRISIAISMPP